MVQAMTIVAATVGTLATGFLVYAVYFDHRRRTDPTFRKELKKESKRQARAAKEEQEVYRSHQKKAVKAAIEAAEEEGYPKDVEEKEAYFMTELATGEKLAAEGTDNFEAALCFYKALKVYPTPTDLMGIYDKTVPKLVLDLLAEMIAADPNLVMSSSAEGLDSGIPSAGLD